MNETLWHIVRQKLGLAPATGAVKAEKPVPAVAASSEATRRIRPDIIRTLKGGAAPNPDGQPLPTDGKFIVSGPTAEG